LVELRDETATARTLVLDVPDWPGHLPGQHVDVRLTAPDGYSTQRSYSIASAPDGTRVELTVQRIPDGEVSPYLTGVFSVGDPVELRGPVGGWFVWRPTDTAPDQSGSAASGAAHDPGRPSGQSGSAASDAAHDPDRPVLLVAGGSGVVPLMAMVRTRAALGSRVPFRLVYSLRTPADGFYADELRRRVRDDPGLDLTYVHTRAGPGPIGRVTVATLYTHGWPAALEPVCYVCGPTGFVETVSDILVALGHDPRRVRTERFG
jgi:ferredoxin-NADP reductase